MKFLKNLLLFLIFVVISALGLSFFAPTQQKVEKSILINAKQEDVYKQMMLLQHFNNWSVWGKADSTIKYQTEGKDGEIGSKIKWQGSPLMAGKGQITLTQLRQNQLIVHDVILEEPNLIKANSTFALSPAGNQTEVKWTFVVPSKRPLNIFNMFYNLEKEKGADFAAGLTALKLMIEKAPLKDPNAMKVQESNFPFTNYAAIRQTVLWDDYPVFFERHFNHLNNYVLKGQPAVKTGLFFKDDQKLRQSQVAAAVTLPVGSKPQLNPPEVFIEVPASRSIEITVRGKDDIKQQAYATLNDYLLKKGLKRGEPVIEQFLKNDSIPETKIIYLLN